MRHKTVSMFGRYNFTSNTDRIEALRKIAEQLAIQPRKQDATVVETPC
jgi:hypothetical protein